MNAQQQEKEFIALVEEYKQVIYKVCYIYANDPENLNDLYQEVVIKPFPASGASVRLQPGSIVSD